MWRIRGEFYYPIQIPNKGGNYRPLPIKSIYIVIIYHEEIE